MNDTDTPAFASAEEGAGCDARDSNDSMTLDGNQRLFCYSGQSFNRVLLRIYLIVDRGSYFVRVGKLFLIFKGMFTDASGTRLWG